MTRRFYLVLPLAATVLALAASNAAARGPANEFAVGSAKTEVNLVLANERASFSAHNTSVFPSCAATGQIVYDTPDLAFTAKIDVLVIGVQAAYFGGPITKVARGPDDVLVGQAAYFDAFDSQQPGGMGDTFILEAVGVPPSPICLPPLLGAIPVTHGNIVIQAPGL